MIRCGFYEKEITPPLGTMMPGYYAVRVATGVLDKLYVKAFVTDDGHTQTAVLAFDAVELPNHFCAALAARIEKQTGISATNVALCANHTHLGIPFDEPQGAKEDPEFSSMLLRLAADCVALAKMRLQPCDLTFATGHVEGVSFVRDIVIDDGAVVSNPSSKLKLVRPYSEADHDLPVLLARNEEGTPVGALISFACHQDCIGGTKFSGDFSSELSRQLKDHYGQDFVSVFVAGACGDINHINFVENYRANYIDTGRKLAAEAIRVAEEEAVPVHSDSISCKWETVIGTYRRPTDEQLAAARKAVETGEIDKKVMLGTLAMKILLEYANELEGLGVQGELPVQVMKFGDVLFFALPGEVYHAFADRIKAACPDRKCIIATICNGDYGYIPTEEMFKTNVYPVQLCHGSRWMPETGDLVTDTAIAMGCEMLSN